VKPLRERVTELLLLHEEHLERRGWDKPPTLRPMYADRWGRVRVGQNVLPSQWQTSPRPFLGMSMLAKGFREGLIPGWAVPGDLLGWAFICEGWSLPVDGSDITDEEALAIADRRLIHQHPLRQEQRVIQARDVDGGDYMVIRLRGEWVRSDGELEGNVTDALVELVDATRAYVR